MGEETRGLFSLQQAAMSASFHSAFPRNAMYYNSGKYMILCMPVGYLPIESINALFEKAAVVKDKTEEMCWLEPSELLSNSTKPFNVNGKQVTLHRFAAGIVKGSAVLFFTFSFVAG
jgi:hypothetical protein